MTVSACATTFRHMANTGMRFFGSTVPCFERDGSLCQWVYEHSGSSESLARGADWFIDRPLRILLTLVIAWILARLARRWAGRIVARVVDSDRHFSEATLQRLGAAGDLLAPTSDPRRASRAQSIGLVLGSTISVIIWTVAFISIVGQLGLDLAPLIAGAGIAGVALGFGAQSLVRDCIAGFFMLLEDQFGIGDVVDLGEASGVVEEVSLRATVLRGLDGTVWHVPNGEITRVGNRSQLWSVAVLDVTVSLGTDLARAKALLHDAAVEVCERDEMAGKVLDGPTVLGAESLGPDGVILRLTVRVHPGAQWDLQRALREQIKIAFEEAGIEIPDLHRAIWNRLEQNRPQPSSDEDLA